MYSQGFTPILTAAFKQLKEAKKSVEIVFVSSDSDEKSFQEYHSTMSFPALPFAKRTEKQQLADMFSVRGIPFLVFINVATGAILKEGRQIVQSASGPEDLATALGL